MIRAWNVIVACTYLCNGQVVILLCALCYNSTLQWWGQREPNEVSADNIAIALGDANAQRDEVFVDGFHHESVPVTIRRLQRVVHEALKLSGFHCLGHKASCQLAGRST